MKNKMLFCLLVLINFSDFSLAENYSDGNDLEIIGGTGENYIFSITQFFSSFGYKGRLEESCHIY